MSGFSIKSFGGISPKTPPRYLQDSQAQVAINCPVFAGSLVPLPDVSATASATYTGTGAAKTIYRYGQDLDSDSSYWFGWNFDVDVCRGQISGDPVEWTFYTGDGYPKATYNTIALGANPLPTASIPLGVPNPSSAPVATPDSGFDSTADYPAVIVLEQTALNTFTTLGAEVSIDNGATFATVSLSALPATNRASYVATQLNAATGISAVVEGLTVKVTSDAVGPTANVTIKAITGTSTEVDETAAFTYTSGFDRTATGTQYPQPEYIIPKTLWSGISAGLFVWFRANNGSDAMIDVFKVAAPSSFSTATALRDWIVTTNGFTGLTITVVGDCLVVSPGATYALTRAVGQKIVPGAIRFIIGAIDEGDPAKTKAAVGTAAPAKLYFSRADYDTYLKGKYYSLVVNGGDEQRGFAYNNVLEFSLPDLVIRELDTDKTAFVIEAGTGTSATLRLRSGTYGTTTDTSYSTISAVGYEDTSSVAETRVYAYTWVSKISTFEFESGPSGPSLAVDVFDGQKVTLSGLETPTTVGTNYFITRGTKTYQVTARRIYRAVNGIYLFVAEIPAQTTSYVDSLAPADLSEEISVTNWAPPPDELVGLINMPNGMMAGFVGRDVYFCDPYHPHAWPENYVQTVDFPIVGLGRMDTTLAVLTKGVPYFIQGSHPDSTVVVKSDIQQSCSSKRSIVSVNGVVIYASPDGLVMLSSGGSKLITENMFTRAQWQEFLPTSIHAYQHDNKYIAFYDNGTTQGGFMFDLISGQFVLHNIYATAGYNDLLRDQLFLAFEDDSIKKWFDGSALSYVWRSKLFTMPQVLTFSCAQVEASAYPVTAKFYCDNSVTPFHTQTVTSRNPFRLPVKVGRDWEVQLEGTAEVFAVNVAQSMQELASA